MALKSVPSTASQSAFQTVYGWATRLVERMGAQKGFQSALSWDRRRGQTTEAQCKQQKDNPTAEQKESNWVGLWALYWAHKKVQKTGHWKAIQWAPQMARMTEHSTEAA